MKWLVPAVAVVALALGASGLTFGIIEHGAIASQQRQARQEQARARRGQAALRSEIRRLSSQVAGLNAPSDPLSAYNEVCNQLMTNSGSGNTQTYYFPCTNSAQTTPQPGY